MGVFDIPVNSNRIARTDDSTKEYAVISENDDLSSNTILLIDDIITDGETKDKI